MSESAPISKENLSTVSAVGLVAAILALAVGLFVLRQHQVLRDMVVALEVRDAVTEQRASKIAEEAVAGQDEKVAGLEKRIDDLEKRLSAAEASHAAEEAAE